MDEKKYIIKDITRIAYVSRAKVNRAIHGRGKVSQETYDKIQRILKKNNYKPNLVAQTLRKGQVCRLAVLLPNYNGLLVAPTLHKESIDLF